MASAETLCRWTLASVVAVLVPLTAFINGCERTKAESGQPEAGAAPPGRDATEPTFTGACCVPGPGEQAQCSPDGKVLGRCGVTFRRRECDGGASYDYVWTYQTCSAGCVVGDGGAGARCR